MEDWYRSWRHEQRARPPQPRWKTWLGDALLIAAIVAFFWASMPA